MDGRYRKNIKQGDLVNIVQKQDQRSGLLTQGLVKRLLTSKPFHPHGIKVQLDTGEVGRVKEVIPEDIDPLP
ncbi:MAG: YwbE family protein [Saprospiraceae bacterium]|nr:YwbE family protein [Saprospiraceae bacterium]